MRCLVVTAHPLSESLCGELTRRIVDRLRTDGHEVVVEDLYREHFDPAMTAAERESYYARAYDSDAVRESAKRLRRAEAVALVFPTWWFGFPAILKGWFDRAWAPGIAYDHAADFGPIRPRLNNLREMLAVTSLGAPWWVDRLVLREPVKKVLKTAIVGTCAPNCRFRMVSLYKSESLTPARIDAFGSKIDGILSGWSVRPAR